MFKMLSKLRRSEEGATAIEYGLIAALVAIALITALGALGDSLGTIFGDVSDTLDTNVDGTDIGS
ncbi:Flp family type IVb pilin [Kordiimonas pumila]|uniref:Flp family type IVb pilin n=1 Tax=Kordiimonas pumila TaxID=2161677 RepID=A0ABV7D5Y6_9PROT|nr:Flp family type IVb pilin [Kordiimonas pumila]